MSLTNNKTMRQHGHWHDWLDDQLRSAVLNRDQGR
jgi:hypothetical protein